MKINFGGRLLVPKPDFVDMWRALFEEYQRETTKVADEAFFTSDSEDETMRAATVQKRMEGLRRLAEIARIYEPRFRALTRTAPVPRTRPKKRPQKKYPYPKPPRR